MTNQLTEGLQQLIGINEELTLETVTNVFDIWTDENTSYLDIIDVLNEAGNEYPITISYLVRALTKCSEVAVKEGYTLKEMVGLIIEFNPYKLKVGEEIIEVNKYPGETGISLKNIIDEVGSLENLKNSSPKDFSVHQESNVKHILNRIEDGSSYFNNIIAV